MSKVSKKEIERILNKISETRKQAQYLIADILRDLGATDKEHGVAFNDWADGDAPSYCSNVLFDHDVVDSFITKIWLDSGLIKVNIHAYYLGQDFEDIDLSDEVNPDYEDILSYLLFRVEE